MTIRGLRVFLAGKAGSATSFSAVGIEPWSDKLIRGEEIGPNPTDRGKPGSKYYVLVDASGIPLAVKLWSAAHYDSRFTERLLGAASTSASELAGPPSSTPTRATILCTASTLYAGKPPPAHGWRGLESGERLGRHC